MGEVSLRDSFGKCIAWAVRKYRLAVNLEIGSWDGTGSTLCLVAGMDRLKGARVGNLKLHCIEADPERFSVLKGNLATCGYAEAYNMSSIGRASFLPKSFDEVWESPFNRHRVDARYPRDLVHSWYDRDVASLPPAGFLESPHALPSYDAVLIDGSEFTGYSEFILLRHRSRFFFLDDVHHAYKCNQVYEELSADPAWTRVAEDAGLRCGFAAFRKIQ